MTETDQSLKELMLTNIKYMNENTKEMKELLKKHDDRLDIHDTAFGIIKTEQKSLRELYKDGIIKAVIGAVVLLATTVGIVILKS